MGTNINLVLTLITETGVGNSRQMDLSSPGIDVKLKERKKEFKN